MEKNYGNFGVVIELLDMKVNIVYGMKVGDFIKFVKEESREFEFPEYSGETQGMVVADYEGDIYYLWVNKLNNYKTISHEATHLATMIMNIKGIPISHDNTEILAHLVGYFVDKIIGHKKELSKLKDNK